MEFYGLIVCLFQNIPKINIMDVVMGKYFELVVTFDLSKFIFQAIWNGDDLEPYPVPSQEFTFQDTSAEGNMSLYYLGYSFTGMWCVI